MNRKNPFGWQVGQRVRVKRYDSLDFTGYGVITKVGREYVHFAPIWTRPNGEEVQSAYTDRCMINRIDRIATEEMIAEMDERQALIKELTAWGRFQTLTNDQLRQIAAIMDGKVKPCSGK